MPAGTFPLYPVHPPRFALTEIPSIFAKTFPSMPGFLIIRGSVDENRYFAYA